MNRQSLLTLPALRGADATPEVRRDFLPAVEPIARRICRTRRSWLVTRHHVASIVQTHAKTRHAVRGASLRLRTPIAATTLASPAKNAGHIQESPK